MFVLRLRASEALNKCLKHEIHSSEALNKCLKGKIHSSGAFNKCLKGEIHSSGRFYKKKGCVLESAVMLNLIQHLLLRE